MQIFGPIDVWETKSLKNCPKSDFNFVNLAMIAEEF